MKRKLAGSDVKNEILRLAQSPEKVKTTALAYYDLMGLDLTKPDVCDAICDWVKTGKELQLKITKNAKGHIGELMYALKPEINGIKCYVEVTIQKNSQSQENLLIISAHVDH
jgi:hypothetical protein